jgi:arabinogalactan endo-1,4-beta-galactosidase
MFFLFDLHMSDTWTNPGAQGTPSAWDDSSLSALQGDVYDYVHDAVSQLIAADARPDVVQIGNEITNGMLWDTGGISGDDFSDFASLLKSGISAVRDIDPSILIMLHIEKCNNLSTTRWWLEGVHDEGVEFDVFGQSCYAPAIIDGSQHHTGYQGSPSEWGPVFNAIASDYPNLKFVIAEYSAEQRAANDVVFNIPDERGLGTFNWDPTRFYDTHPNVPLFEPVGAWNDFVVVQDRMSIYDEMATYYAAAGR